MWRFQTVVTVLVLCALGPAPAAERAVAGYPSKPIRLIIPFPPGGGNDTMARAIGGKLSEAWGQQVVYDNRPGANGLLACEITAKAAPDGYTLLMANVGSHAINPALYKKIPYDPIRDFAPVSLLGTTANVLVTPPSIPARNLAELITLAKAKPGQLTYGSNGSGSSQHLAGVMFSTAFGVKLVHVPYKGTGPMVTDLLGGQITLSFGNMVAVLPHIKSKRLNPIAVTSLKRAAVLPDIPAVAETLPGFEATSWWSVVSTRGTPPEIVAALNREIRKGLSAENLQDFFSRSGVEPRGTTPEELAAFIRSELVKWGKVVKDSGAQVD